VASAASLAPLRSARSLPFDAFQLMTGGRQVRGIIEGESIPKLFIPKLLDLYSQGRFPFDRLVKFYDFNLFNEAIADSESGRVIRLNSNKGTKSLTGFFITFYS
jgi:Zn-dependent alcohol dehydrogenase